MNVFSPETLTYHDYVDVDMIRRHFIRIKYYLDNLGYDLVKLCESDPWIIGDDNVKSENKPYGTHYLALDAIAMSLYRISYLAAQVTHHARSILYKVDWLLLVDLQGVLNVLRFETFSSRITYEFLSNHFHRIYYALECDNYNENY